MVVSKLLLKVCLRGFSQQSNVSLIFQCAPWLELLNYMKSKTIRKLHLGSPRQENHYFQVAIMSYCFHEFSYF